MKKWLMSAFLPLLLLAQQEAGATTLPQTPPFIPAGSTLIKTLVAVSTGFNAEFDFYDTNGNNTTAEGIGIGAYFGSNVSLNVAKTVVQDNGTLSVPAAANSLMQFAIGSLSDGSFSPTVLRMLNLIPMPPPPFNPPYVRKETTETTEQTFYLPPDYSNLMTTNYLRDGADAGSVIQVGQLVCMWTRADTTWNTCATVAAPVSVPVPNSLMLLGIGLLALTVPQRRGKLFNIPL